MNNTERWKYTKITQWLDRDYETPEMNTPKIIHIPKNTVLDKPIYMTELATQLSHPTLLSTHCTINLEENSCATVVQIFQAEQADHYWRKKMTDIHLAAGAQLNYYQIQMESETSLHTHEITVQQARDSQFNSFTLDNGGGIVRTDLQAKLQGAGAICQFYGVYLVKNKQHVDNHTSIEHLSPHTHSTELYKGIVADHARAVFNGRVYVAPQAQKIVSKQHNKNLLLSKTAEIDTKPELEIYADDVQCAHGATVGQLDPEAIFYLTTRGIDEQLSKEILMYGFADELINQINDVEIRQLFNKQLLTWFGHSQIAEKMP